MARMLMQREAEGLAVTEDFMQFIESTASRRRFAGVFGIFRHGISYNAAGNLE